MLSLTILALPLVSAISCAGFVDIGQHDPGDIFSLGEHAAQHGRLGTGSDDNYLLHHVLH